MISFFHSSGDAATVKRTSYLLSDTGPCSDSRTNSQKPVDFYRGALAFAALDQRPLRALLLLVLLGLVSDNILDYLFWAKSAEEDIWLRDDIAIAIRTVVLAAEGCQNPSVVACYEVLGVHPSEVAERMEEQRRAIMGNLYLPWAEERVQNLADIDSLISAMAAEGAAAIPRTPAQLPPRKPSQSSPLPLVKGKAA